MLTCINSSSQNNVLCTVFEPKTWRHDKPNCTTHLTRSLEKLTFEKERGRRRKGSYSRITPELEPFKLKDYNTLLALIPWPVYSPLATSMAAPVELVVLVQPRKFAVWKRTRIT